MRQVGVRFWPAWQEADGGRREWSGGSSAAQERDNRVQMHHRSVRASGEGV